MEKKTISQELEAFVLRLFKYADHTLAYYKYSALESGAKLSSKILGLTIVFLSLTVVSIFFSFALAFFIGETYGNFSLGFLLVGTLYVIAGIVVFKYRNRWLINPIIKELSQMNQELNEESKHV